MPREMQLDAGDQVIDKRFFAEHPDALMYVRWATVAECEVQHQPLGTVIIVMRRSPTDPNYLRVWCQPEPGRPIHETFAVFGQLPTVSLTAPDDDQSR